MARNEQTIRQHRILQILEASRYGRTLAELRDEIVEGLGLDSLSERTVRRDCEALQAAGFDIDSHADERGPVWKLGPRMQRLPELAASATELLALSMGRDLLTPLNGTPFWQGIESLWQKMRTVLPESVWEHFAKQRQTLLVRGSLVKSYAEKKGILSVLNRAIAQHRVVETIYRSATHPEGKRRRIEPLSLVLYRNSLYLVATDVEDPRDQPPRHWKLERFDAADVTDEYFTPREDFDPEAHFAGCLGLFRAGEPVDAEIRIAADAARWVEENPWHPRQEAKRRPDGSLLLVLRGVHPPELLPRVLALGAAAEIESPPELRAAAAAELRAALARYPAPAPAK
ncbi:MAG TPA: transcriptional regulator [Planctomycetia bacterium]|nr:transcriptional regulator [Planctomycetia bacterium]